MERAILLLASGALLAATVGCSLCHSCRECCATCSCPAGEPPPPVVERTSQEPIIRVLAASVQPPIPPSSTLPSPDLESASAEEVYRAVEPSLCQCLAAKHAPLAEGFDSQRRQLEEKQAQASCLCGSKSEKQRAFQEAMLLYSALESRDQAAGAALEWYYQLAGAEARADVLNQSLVHGRDTCRRTEELKDLGISLPSPIEEYRRQIVDLQLQQGQNQIQIEQLNTKIRLAMGYDPKDVWRVWPDSGMPLAAPTGQTPGLLVPEVEAAVQLGLHQRPQLLLLRSMIANLDCDTLGSSRTFLQTLNPLLAMSDPGPSCKLLKILGKILHIQPGQKDELERIRAQLCDNLCERERTVEAEIRLAVSEIRARRQTILRARQAADSWQARIDDLKKEKAEGLEGALDLASAYLEWYKTRGEVVKEFLAWKIAIVKLKQAQGILPAECGYAECQPN